MTDPTTVFDLSTPTKVEALRLELSAIVKLLAEREFDDTARGILTRRRDRIIAALDTLEG